MWESLYDIWALLYAVYNSLEGLYSLVGTTFWDEQMSLVAIQMQKAPTFGVLSVVQDQTASRLRAYVGLSMSNRLTSLTIL